MTTKKKQKMTGYMIFWYIIASLSVITNIGAIISSLTAGDTSEDTTTTVFTIALLCVYYIVCGTLIAFRKGRLFIAVSHFVLGGFVLFASLMMFAFLGDLDRATQGIFSFMAGSVFALMMLLMIAIAAFYIGTGFYFALSKRAKAYFGDEETEEIAAPAAAPKPVVMDETSKVTITCNKCKSQVKYGMKFCPECGTELQ
ncbi:hypothetical protein IKX12_04050 [Candidatus Saccharibacteria bacterium]|nr:hypothetical protein [Candidatus Saccharibacteria bacterium]